MDLHGYPHYKENGEEQWEPCLPTPLQPIPSPDQTEIERAEFPVPPPPPASKRRKETGQGKKKVRTSQKNRDEFRGDDAEQGTKMQPHALQQRMNKWTEKLGISGKGLKIFFLLLLLLLICFVIIVIIAALWPRQPSEEPAEVCSTPPCLRAAAQVLGSLNESSSACQDFWEFSCGGWLDSNPLPPSLSKWGITEALSHQAVDKLRRLLVTRPYPTRVDSVAWKVKYFYESCTDLEHIVVPEQKLRRSIDQIGGWEVLRTFSMYTWNFKMTLRRLHAEYGINAFFAVDVAPHPYNVEKSIVRISPGGLGLPDRSYYYRTPDHATLNTYKQFLKDAVQLLGATSPDASKFADEVFHYEKRIAELTPTSAELRNPLNTVNLLTVAELQKQSFSIPWLEILRAIYPSGVIDDSTELWIVSPQYLRDVSVIISTSDRSTLNNYVMWRFANVMLPYLSKNYWDLVDAHRKDMFGSKTPVDRWEMCMVTTQKYFRLALGTLYSERNDKLMEARHTMQNLFESLRNELGKNLATSAWYNAGLRNRAVEKLRTITLQVGYPESLASTSYLDEYYVGMSVQVNDFYANVEYGVHFQRKLQERLLLNPTPESRWIEALNKQNIIYIPQSNKVVVPDLLLESPFYCAKCPLPMLYGMVGTQMAQAMLDAVMEFGILYDTQGSLAEKYSPVANESTTLLTMQRQCVTEVLNQHRIDDSEILEKTASSNLAELLATQTALRALSNRMNSRKVEYAGMQHLSNTQLFFISYAQSLCSVKTPQHRDFERSTSFRIGEKERLTSVLLQVPEFMHGFRCNETSTYYSKKTCGPVL